MNSALPSPKKKVVLVEDHPIFRHRLAHLINKELGMMVCGETDNIREAVVMISAAKPDIAIVDISLRGSSGIELIKDLKAQGVVCPVLVLSMHDEKHYAERVLRAGAQGYITKNQASSEVVSAIRRVLAGEVYVSSVITAKILQRFSHNPPGSESAEVALLTDRELEVFELSGQGLNTPEIARRLNLGESTVDTYRTRIKEKLHLRNAAELYRRAAQWVKDQS